MLCVNYILIQLGEKKCRFSGLTTELLNQNSLDPRNLCFSYPGDSVHVNYCLSPLQRLCGFHGLRELGIGREWGGWGGWRSELSSTVPFSKTGREYKSPKGKRFTLHPPTLVDVLTDFFIPAFLLKSEPSKEEIQCYTIYTDKISLALWCIKEGDILWEPADFRVFSVVKAALARKTLQGNPEQPHHPKDPCCSALSWQIGRQESECFSIL